MELLLLLIGLASLSIGVGLWIGYTLGYGAAIRGQRAWLELHCPGFHTE